MSKENKNNGTLKFVKPPSLIDSLGRIFDFGGSIPIFSFPEDPDLDPDTLALYSDWLTLKDDLNSSFKIVGKIVDGKIREIESKQHQTSN